MAKFIATQSLIKAVCACTSQAQIEQVIKPQRWLDCQAWFLHEARSTPSGAMYKGDRVYSDGSVINITENKTLVKECLEKAGEGYSTAIINSAKSTLKSFKDWGWDKEQWLFVLKSYWNGTGRQGSPRIHGCPIESEMLWDKNERASQKFAKLLRQIKAFRGEPIPAFEKLCLQPVAQPTPQPVAQPKAEPAPQPQPQPTAEDWRAKAIKAAIAAGLSDDGLGKLVKTLFA